MQLKQGIKVSPGVAICQALVIDAEDQPIPKRTVARSRQSAELERLDAALKASGQDIEDLRKHATTKVGPELAKIFDVHLVMLKDKHLVAQFREAISTDSVTAEYAVYSVMRRQQAVFSQMDKGFFRERANDLWDIEKRIIGHLIGDERAHLTGLKQDVILVAHDLTPSQTASLDKSRIKGIATNAGGQTSHTAILAHAQGIPAIVGLENITSLVSSGDTIIIDGHKGMVIISPDAAQLMEYRQQAERFALLETQFDELAHLPAVTRDGKAITLLANIEFPDEVPPAVAKGAMGIGLYRTEFLFLSADEEPDEEQQYAAYKRVIDLLKGKPLTIRTLDLGADKVAHIDGLATNERNPFLGCRSIRLCLQNLPLFKTQLRAILRASVHGQVRIMFPLISNVMELRQARMILNDVMEDMTDQGHEFNHHIPVGIMVEVPSAALQAKTLAREVDFFSIGTNDLIQYTVAVDRGNERIANLYSGAHPAVVQLIKDVARAGVRGGIEVSLCGEMAGEPQFVPLLIGLGLKKLSMTPPALPEVKKVIRSVTMDQCQKIARKVSGMESDREVLNYLRDEMRKVLPEAMEVRGSTR
ncbi:MAG: phosphoenolpyruvate--protein phosphotransferase [Phycisphaera sp.]|nr:phosphoenolpyruvate--protein phosphotransferase [Phycisphaera sp.]